MQAIRTKFIGPTNTRNTRIKASSEAGYKFYEWDSALDERDNHQRAAAMWAAHLGWAGTFFGGGYGDSWYWVCTPMNPGATPRFSLPLDGIKPKWSVEAGRTICRRDMPFVYVNRHSASPVEADAITHTIVEALNILGVS